MSDMKCPFCQQELDYLAEDIYGGMRCPNCKKHDLFGNEKMWQELIRTRKELEIAIDALDTMVIDDNISGIFARNAIKQIKALEQKEKK